MQQKDICSRAPLEHLDLKVLEALLKGHIIECKQGEFRYAIKDQELWSEKGTSEDGDLVYVAMESGLFTKAYTFNSYSAGASLEKGNASGFRWLFQSDSIGYMRKLIEAMEKDEKLKIISGLAFDNVVSSCLSR